MNFDERIHKFTMNPDAILWTAASLFVLHAVVGRILNDYTYVDRCGALWVILGGVLVLRPILRVGYPEWYRRSRVIDVGTLTTTPQDREEGRQKEIDARCVQIIGPYLGMLGTLLWAYGSVLWKLWDALAAYILKHIHG
jgi:hypothetical protein